MSWRDRWDRILPQLVIWPPLLISCTYVLAFSAWTVFVSFTRSTLLPEYSWAGWRNYTAMLASRNWHIAYTNLFIYSGCFVVLTMGIGLLLAVLIDQRIRGENIYRTIFLYPLAVSFVVTGTVWGWLLNPSLGVQKLMHDLGWTSFKFEWLIDRDMAIYTIVIAGVWQASGFAMALLLAGLRSVDSDLYKAAQIDGSGALRTYRRVIFPTILPALLTGFALAFARATGEYGSVIFIAGNMPMVSEITPLFIITKLEQYDYAGATAIAVVMLTASFLLLLSINLLQAWSRSKNESAA